LEFEITAVPLFQEIERHLADKKAKGKVSGEGEIEHQERKP
jgi:hypothetical protein